MFRLRTAQKKFRNVAFSPSALFQTGDILLWYDSSDLTTMFKDTAGTQPVTADGDSVALMLDKGQWGGKTLEQVLLDPTNLKFSDDFSTYADTAAVTAAGWDKRAATDGTVALVAGELQFTRSASGLSTAVSRLFSDFVVGNLYRIKANIRKVSGFGSVAIQLRTSDGGGGSSLTQSSFISATSPTETYWYWIATQTSAYVSLLMDTASATGGMDDVSIVHVPGYHRTQATGTSMPKYKTGPNPAAAENSSELVTNGTFSTDTTGWTGFGATLAVVSGEIEVTNSADAAGYTEAAAFTTVSGRSYRITGTARRGTSSSISINVRAAGGAGISSLTLTSTVNQDFEFTFTATSTSSTIWLICNQAVTGRTGYFDNVSVKEIPASAPYIHWLLYDGTDDSHATGTITWGADEVAICAGVTKSSDAAAGAFLESSSTSASNNGTFALLSPSSAAANYFWRTKGTGASDQTRTTYAAPTTNVLTSLGKIGDDTNRFRINVDEATVATDQGTGNFGSYVLYFGRRDGSSLPFNGREYQTVIRSRLLSAAELSSLETFVAGKTGIIL